MYSCVYFEENCYLQSLLNKELNYICNRIFEVVVGIWQTCIKSDIFFLSLTSDPCSNINKIVDNSSVEC